MIIMNPSKLLSILIIVSLLQQFNKFTNKIPFCDIDNYCLSENNADNCSELEF